MKTEIESLNKLMHSCVIVPQGIQLPESVAELPQRTVLTIRLCIVKKRDACLMLMARGFVFQTQSDLAR